jgi:methionyl aminopeptidase
MVANKIESYIIEQGANPAFPVNISKNEIAAHFSPKYIDDSVFNKGDIIKLDVGSHIDGYIADAAITIEIESNKYIDLIKSSSEALDNAIQIIKPGVSVSKIGVVIESTIKSYNFNPIDNLTGHSLDRYQLHSGISIPNVANSNDKTKLKYGDVIAIEPFSTIGNGHVVSGDGSNIYIVKSSLKSRLIREKKLKILFDDISNRFGSLPFAQRWCNNMTNNVDISLKKLSFFGVIKHYPQLVEQSRSLVTQKEHTVIVQKRDCEVITEL